MDSGVLSQTLVVPPSKKGRVSGESGLHVYSCPRGEVRSGLGGWRPFTQGPTSSSTAKAEVGPKPPLLLAHPVWSRSCSSAPLPGTGRH